MITIRTVTVTRYMQPLREGGSLPALAEADDGFKYVVKFRGGGVASISIGTLMVLFTLLIGIGC